MKKNEISVEDLQNGKEEAYAILYDMYYENLVRYCFNLTNDLALAEDIVQNLLVKIWVNRINLNINISLKGYLYRGVYNEFVKEYNKGKRREKALLEIKYEVLDHMLDIDHEQVNKKMKLLEEAIEKLPKKCKKVFLLSKKQGYKYKEIASQLNISEKAVEKHISRAIKRLKQTLSHSSHIFMIFFSRRFTQRKNH